MARKVLEKTIERELVRRVIALGGLCEKVVVVGKRGFFDRLAVLPGPRIMFVECKRPRGGLISPHQRRYHAEFAALGATVAVVRNMTDIDRLLELPGCDNSWYQSRMSRSTRKKPKAGRPKTTGSGVQVMVRMHKAQLRAIDRWIRDTGISRPEAIRRLVDLAFEAKQGVRICQRDIQQ